MSSIKNALTLVVTSLAVFAALFGLAWGLNWLYQENKRLRREIERQAKNEKDLDKLNASIGAINREPDPLTRARKTNDLYKSVLKRIRADEKKSGLMY